MELFGRAEQIQISRFSDDNEMRWLAVVYKTRMNRDGRSGAIRAKTKKRLRGRWIVPIERMGWRERQEKRTEEVEECAGGKR